MFKSLKDWCMRTFLPELERQDKFVCMVKKSLSDTENRILTLLK